MRARYSIYSVLAGDGFNVIVAALNGTKGGNSAQIAAYLHNNFKDSKDSQGPYPSTLRAIAWLVVIASIRSTQRRLYYCSRNRSLHWIRRDLSGVWCRREGFYTINRPKEFAVSSYVWAFIKGFRGRRPY